MNSQDAIACLDKVFSRCLTSVEEKCLAGCFDGLTYQEIGEKAGYSADYIKDVGATLWKELSGLVGQKVSKANFKAAIRKLCCNDE